MFWNLRLIIIFFSVERYEYGVADVDLPELPFIKVKKCSKELPGISLRPYQSQAIQWMVPVFKFNFFIFVMIFVIIIIIITGFSWIM